MKERLNERMQNVNIRQVPTCLFVFFVGKEFGFCADFFAFLKSPLHSFFFYLSLSFFFSKFILLKGVLLASFIILWALFPTYSLLSLLLITSTFLHTTYLWLFMCLRYVCLYGPQITFCWSFQFIETGRRMHKEEKAVEAGGMLTKDLLVQKRSLCQRCTKPLATSFVVHCQLISSHSYICLFLHSTYRLFFIKPFLYLRHSFFSFSFGTKE